MQQRKKNKITLLTSFIQNTKSTYVQTGQELKKYIKKLEMPYSNWYNFDDLEMEKRISKLAQGSKPNSEELQGFALWLFKDSTQWRKFFFPNERATYTFIRQIYNDEINNIFSSKELNQKLQQKLTLFTKSKIRNGVNHHSTTAIELTYIILGLLNFKMLDELRLGKNNEKEDLQKYAIDWINTNLYSNSPLVEQLTTQLRNTLDLDHNRKKELEKVVLRQLISVL